MFRLSTFFFFGEGFPRSCHNFQRLSDEREDGTRKKGSGGAASPTSFQCLLTTQYGDTTLPVCGVGEKKRSGPTLFQPTTKKKKCSILPSSSPAAGETAIVYPSSFRIPIKYPSGRKSLRVVSKTGLEFHYPLFLLFHFA